MNSQESVKGVVVGEPTKDPIKANPFKLTIGVSQDVKRAVEAVPTTKRKVPNKIERKEIDTNTFE